MADEHRHAHAGRGELDVGIENLLRLDHHLPFFLGEAGIEEDVDMRDDVEGDLLGEFLDLDRIGDEHRARLAEQFVHRVLAGAGHRLIGRDDDALDLRCIVQRLQRHDELRGRAIGIGDDAFLDAASSASAFTSGTISGTSRSMRQALELSITIAPCGRDLGRPILGDRAARATSARCRCP